MHLAGKIKVLVQSKTDYVEEITFETMEELLEMTKSRNNPIISIEFPEGIEKIKTGSFNNCYHLRRLVLPKSLKEIEDSAFGSQTGAIEIVNFSDLYLQRGSSEHGNVAKYAKSISSYSALDSYINITDDGFYYYCDQNEAVLLGYAGSETEIVLPNDLQDGLAYSIADYAFAYNTDIKSVIVPGKASHIGKGAFLGCKSMTHFALTSYRTSIDALAFFECAKLEKIYLDCLVESIGDNLFAGCKRIKEISLPGSLKAIGAFPFADCKGLCSISFSGDVEMWKKIEKHDLFGEGVRLNTNVQKVECSDGDVHL